MEFRLLGPLEVRDGERTVPLTRRQQRTLLAALLVRAGEVVSTERLIDEIWGDDPPRSAVGSLQNTVAELRKLLGAGLVLTHPPGYRLDADPDAVDARRFERLLGESARLGPAERAAALREALALWRGPALADLGDAPWIQAEAARLDELRLAGLEERIEAELDLGHHTALVAQIQALAAEHPLRERFRRQLALALYRSGRQAEALEACREARAALDELGLEPSAELRQLERDILQQSAALAPPAEVPEEAAEETPGERRVVSVLAAAIPEDDDPETLRATLARVLEAATAAVGRHGGVVERFGPEGLTAVFGVDGTREDDALRAVRAAVELSDAAGLELGVATAEALIGGEPRVAGSAVARAAGLARTGGGVLVDPQTFELVRDAVEAETSGPVARVLSVEPGRPERHMDTQLVGRQEELVRLRAAFDTAVGKRRCVAAGIVGEPGIGKTRLARELVRSLDATVLVARCAAYGEGATFLPIVDALRGVDADTVMEGEVDAEVVVRRLGQLAGATHEPASLGELLWAARRLLETLARERPVALVLDDVHWAEPALLDLVEYLAARAEGAPLFVLTLARPELLDARPGWSAGAVALGPLDDHETQQVVANAADVLDDETRSRIVSLADGNPLHAEQLAVFAAESGKALEPGAMPATLEAVLAGRLGRLEADERTTLQLAAVVGRHFSRGAVAALARPDLAVDAHLLALARRGFVRAAASAAVGDDAYRFHHVLLRDAAYATLTKAARADLHERVAACLDRDGPGDDAIVGYHLEQAYRYRAELAPGDDRTADLAERAGERVAAAAMRVWRMNDALAASAQLGRATELLSQGTLRGEMLWEQARSLAVLGRASEAEDALARAHADAVASDSRAVATRTRVERIRVELFAGGLEPQDAERELREAITVLEAEGDDRGLGRAWNALGATFSFRGLMEGLAETSVHASEHYARAGFSPAVCIVTQAEALYHGPMPVAEALSACAALLARAPDRASDAHILTVMGALHALGGQVSEGRHYTDRSFSLYEELGFDVAIQTIWTPLRMEIERLDGDLPTAVRLGQESCAALSDSRDQAFLAARAAYLAHALYADRRWEDAEQFCELSRTTALPQDVIVEAAWRSVAAMLLGRRGKQREAEHDAREAVTLIGSTDALSEQARVQLALAEVLRLDGRHDEARSVVDVARELLARKGNRAALVALEREQMPMPA